MNVRRVFGFVGVGVVLAVSLSIAIFLWYYRPTIEYAYVDILDLRDGRTSLGWLIGVGLAVLVVAAAIWWRKRPHV
jgi:hypothetical protein